MVKSKDLDINDFENFNDWIEAKRELEEQERLQFLEDTREKCYQCNDGDFHYRLLVLRVCEKYNLDTDYPPDVAYRVVNNYVEKINDISFEDYICGPNAPLIRPSKEIRKIFYEFDFLEKNSEIIELANKVYNLNLEIASGGIWGESYLFSESFSFESFTPIDIKELHTLKQELEVLKKHNTDTKTIKEVEEQIKNYGLTDDILELI